MPVEHGFRPRPIGQRLNAPFNDGASSGGILRQGEPGRRGRVSVESRLLSVFNGIERHEGLPVNARKVSEAFYRYQDQVWAKARGLTITEIPGKTPRINEIRTPISEDKALLEVIRHVRDAFDIVAYPFFDSTYQQVLSGEVYGNPLFDADPEPTHQGEFTLTPEEKRILSQITTAAGIPDNPDQQTYSYFSIPRWTVVEGTVEE